MCEVINTTFYSYVVDKVTTAISTNDHKRLHHGWTTFFISGEKSYAGWYNQHKRDGIMLYYTTNQHGVSVIESSRMYDNDILISETRYKDNEPYMTIPYRNNKVHGFVYVPGIDVYQLWINDMLIAYDILNELGIDVENQSIHDLCTLHILGL